MPKGITLIGMPGSGKSTIGKLLAERVDFHFIDLDSHISEREKEPHYLIAKRNGQTLLDLEEKYALELPLGETVLAPGGSIIYSEPAMDRLRRDTTVVYLEMPLQEIEHRLSRIDLNFRGIIGMEEKGIDGLFRERVPLYEKYAHVTVPCAGLKTDDVVDKIISRIS